MQSTNRLTQYFVEPENRFLTQARFNVKECIPEMIGKSRVLGEALPAGIPENFLVFEKASPEKVVSILREHGIQAKIFAIHVSRKQTFEVKSMEFDWEVMPLARSKVKVPSEILERVDLLLNRGIEIEKLYMAKPKQYALAGLLKAEISLQSKILSEEIASIAIEFLAGAEEAIRALEEARKKKQNPVSMIPRYMPDPVLLAKIKEHNELVEIGRWI